MRLAGIRFNTPDLWVAHNMSSDSTRRFQRTPARTGDPNRVALSVRNLCRSCSFAPPGLGHIPLPRPTACAVGCIFTPLRGYSLWLCSTFRMPSQLRTQPSAERGEAPSPHKQVADKQVAHKHGGTQSWGHRAGLKNSKQKTYEGLDQPPVTRSCRQSQWRSQRLVYNQESQLPAWSNLTK
jgi:hypothetical protein